MKKRIFVITLCFVMLFTTFGYLGISGYIVQKVSAAEETEDLIQKTDTEDSLYEKLITSETIEDMYLVVLDYMQNDTDLLCALTADEINALEIHVSELDPEGDDTDTADLLDTLDYIKNKNNDTMALAIADDHTFCPLILSILKSLSKMMMTVVKQTGPSVMVR